jgi:hypothetical protein
LSHQFIRYPNKEVTPPRQSIVRKNKVLSKTVVLSRTLKLQTLADGTELIFSEEKGKTMDNSKFKIEIVSGHDIATIWNGTHDFFGNRIPEAYNVQFNEGTQEPIVDLIKWQQDGDELFLLSYDPSNPDAWVGYVIDWHEDHSDRLLLAYYLHGADASFTRTSMEEARTGSITVLERSHLHWVTSVLSNRFGANTILVAEMEHDWDRDTYDGLGFYASKAAYVAPLLEGADAPGQAEEAEEGGTHYVLAGIRVGNNAVEVTDEDLAASAPAIDAIYASATAEEEDELHTEPPVEAEVRLASDIEQPPTVEGTSEAN